MRASLIARRGRRINDSHGQIAIVLREKRGLNSCVHVAHSGLWLAVVRVPTRPANLQLSASQRAVLGGVHFPVPVSKNTGATSPCRRVNRPPLTLEELTAIRGRHREDVLYEPLPSNPH